MGEIDIRPIQAQAANYFRSMNLKTFPIFGIAADGECLCGKKSCGSAGKHSMVSGWNTGNHFKSEEEIFRHWERNPGSNYGIVTDGLLIVDVDGPDGERSYAKYISTLVSKIKTLKVRTGKGWHEYYLDTKGEFKSGTKILPGIDIRAVGGCVVGPCSKHRSLNFYEVINNGSKDSQSIEIAAAPEELRNLILDRSRIVKNANKEAIKASLALGVKVSEGGRDVALTSYLGAFVHKNLSEQDIMTLAFAFNRDRLSPPLEDWEVIKTVKSVMNYHPGNIAPMSLFRDIAPSSRYPIESLGEVLHPAVLALQEAIQAPEALIGQSLLAAASLAVQGHANVQIDNRSYPTSLYLLSVGVSGERKSAVDREALFAHREYEYQKQSEYKQQLASYLSAKQIYEAQYKSIVNSPKKSRHEKEQQILQLGAIPTPPLSQDILIEEPTYEGLVKVLQMGRSSIGLFSDEGGRMIGGHGMSSENLLKTIAGFSSLWDGTPISRVRAGEGTVKLYGRRLALHLMVQPGVADLLLGNATVADQGLLARCLIAFPESTVGARRYKAVDLRSNPAMQKYWDVLRSILCRPLPMASDKNELVVRSILLAHDAYSAWVEFHNEVESQMSSDGKYLPIRGFASKAAEQAIRISGVLTLLKDLDSKIVSKQQMQGAIELVRYYLSEFLRLNCGSILNPDLLLAKRLLEWCQTYNEVYLSQIYQYGPYGLRDKSTAKRIAGILEQHYWLKKIVGGKKIDGKRRADVWEVVRETI